MSKIVKNVTASAITVNDVGVTIPALSQYTIPAQDYLLWAASNNVITFIGSVSLVINDGSVDLNISDGIFLIKGLFPTTYAISNPAIDRVDLTTAGTEYSYTFPAAIKEFTLKTRSYAKLQLAWTPGQSGTNFASVESGAAYSASRISRNASLTVYVQASKNNEVLEIEYWT